jgi:hypothetical protein
VALVAEVQILATVSIQEHAATEASVLQGKAIQEAQALDLMQTLKTRTMVAVAVEQLVVGAQHPTVVKIIEEVLEAIW